MAKRIRTEFRALIQEGVEGFKLMPTDEINLFKWEGVIFGPPDTIYRGGYFEITVRFPIDYPFKEPVIKFCCPMVHPNIYLNGQVCFSLLGYDRTCAQTLECWETQKWTPYYNVATCLKSVVSLLRVPDVSRPRNSDAAAMYQRWTESGGQDDDFEEAVLDTVRKSAAAALRDNVQVPMTMEEYEATGKTALMQMLPQTTL